MEVAIITGAGSGIGLATAKALYGMGMAIVGVGRDPGKLATLASEIDDPGRLATLAVDITEETAPQAIVKLTLERFGRIDFLINNAGIGKPKPLHGPARRLSMSPRPMRSSAGGAAAPIRPPRAA